MQCLLSFNNETKTITQWSRQLEVPYMTMRDRYTNYLLGKVTEEYVLYGKNGMPETYTLNNSTDINSRLDLDPQLVHPLPKAAKSTYNDSSRYLTMCNDPLLARLRQVDKERSPIGLLKKLLAEADQRKQETRNKKPRAKIIMPDIEPYNPATPLLQQREQETKDITPRTMENTIEELKELVDLTAWLHRPKD